MDPIILTKNLGQVAGIEISKGEPGVVKALQKLWQKLQLLEQACYAEKTDTATQKDEWTLPEVQQRLLELQIQYVRSILHQNNNIGTTHVPHGEMDATKETSQKDGIQLSSLHECGDHIPVRDCYDKHTQTDSASTKFTNSLYTEEEITQAGSMKNKEAVSVRHKKEFMLPDFHGMKTTDGPRVKPHALNVGLKQKNLRTHYHLKLSDVPFIIGTSTSSHSVVANVQKIISMMKVHNKGLCSSAPNLARRSPALDVRKHDGQLGYQRTYSSPDLSKHWDLKDILLCLTDELKTLTSKLENMKKIPDNPHSSELSKHLHEDYVNTINLIEMKTKQIAALRKAIRKHPTEVFPYRRQKSFSESSPYSHYSEKLTSSSKDISFMNRISKTEVKHVICSFSDASCKADGSDRRKIMRELKEIQVHLQHEDIHWK